MRLIQFLVTDLAREETEIPIESGQSYPVWSPHDAFGAGGTLLKVLGGTEGGRDQTLLSSDGSAELARQAAEDFRPWL